MFWKETVGEYKAKAAADFVMKRVPGVTIKYFTDPIQNYDNEFYKFFDIIIGGLDNVEAWSFINQTVHELVEFNLETKQINMESVIPFIDGGTEGFGG